MILLRYAGLKENDIVDGEGLCVSFWVQGCCHRCDGCHNPDTWDINGGLELPNTYVDGIISLLSKNGIQRNLSILGGEPCLDSNMSIVLPLVKKVYTEAKFSKIYLWSGFTFEELLQRDNTKELLQYIDVLVDGRFELEHRDITLKFRGSPNQRVIDVQKSLSSGKVVLYCA